MSTLLEKLADEEIPALRLFFTGLLAMSHNPDPLKNNVTVGIQDGVAGHHLSITAMMRPKEENSWGRSHALYAGLPVKLHHSTSPNTGHWKLNVVGSANRLDTVRVEAEGVVLDGPGFYDTSLTGWLDQSKFSWKFSFDRGEVYSSTVHLRLNKTTPSNAIPSQITAGMSFGVNLYLEPGATANITGTDGKPVFAFSPDCRYDLYVSCLPLHADQSARGDESGSEESDFQLHYNAFSGILTNNRYNIFADTPGAGEVVPDVNFVNPCVPIYLGQTPIEE